VIWLVALIPVSVGAFFVWAICRVASWADEQEREAANRHFVHVEPEPFE